MIEYIIKKLPTFITFAHTHELQTVKYPDGLSRNQLIELCKQLSDEKTKYILIARSDTIIYPDDVESPKR